MKELFDERLSQKIRQTFDKHEEPYNAQGWEMMKQQMQAQKSGKVRALLLSLPAKVAAAAVLVLGGVLTYSTINSNGPSQKPLQAETNRTIQQQGFEGVKVLPPSLDDEHVAQNQGRTSANKKTVDNQSVKAHVSPQKKEHQVALVASTLPNTKTTKVDKQLVSPTRIDQIPSKDLAKGLVVQYDVNSLAALNTTNQGISQNQGVPAVIRANYMPVQNSKVSQQEEVNLKSSPFKLGVVVSSLVNYSDKGEKDSQVNMGGGVLSEISLSKRLSITSGVLLTRQSLEMSRPADLPKFTTSQSLGSNQFFANRSQEQSRSVRMQFVGLDIPVNLQYHLGKNVNQGLYVSVGLSSMAYLQEDYTHTTRETIQRQVYKPGVTASPTVETYVSETNLKSNPESLSRFDFARMLNVSMGMKYMVAQNMQILIEPYLKYPLGTLTNEQLRFGSAGVNLRCSFTGVRRH
ncbi:hypothetical protein BKI52_07275 [marine bacterium AO1-C]|nr:hypothetical protein BKI52_07275 [marine bacterium AO1-C]